MATWPGSSTVTSMLAERPASRRRVSSSAAFISMVPPVSATSVVLLAR